MLEELLSCKFDNEGIHLKPDMDVLKYHQFIHEAIADDHLPVRKIVGFYLDSYVADMSRVSVTERNVGVLESMPTIAYNLSDKVFTQTSSTHLDFVPVKGACEIEDLKNNLKMQGGTDVMSLNSHIYSSSQPVSIHIIVMSSFKCWSMEKSARIMDDTSYFPMYVRFSIHPFCRMLLPIYGNVLKYKMLHGFTPELLVEHLSRMREEGDFDWLSKYED